MSALVRILIPHYCEIALRDKIDNALLDKINLDIAVKRLWSNLSLLERRILYEASWGESPVLVAEGLGISSWKYQKVYKLVCAKIAKELGFDYSDQRLEQLLKRRTSLTTKDLAGLRELVS